MDYKKVLPALKKCLEPKNKNSVFPNLYFSEGEITATDKVVLAAVKCEYPDEYEGKVVEPNLNITALDWADTKKLVNFYSSEMDEVKDDYLIENLSAACNKIKDLPTETRVLIQISGATYVPENVLRLTGVFKAAKEPFRFYLSRANTRTPIAILTSKSITAMLMPVVDSGSCDNFTVERAMAYGAEVVTQDPVTNPVPAKHKELSIDIETYSPVSLKDSGVYKYAEHRDFRILLFAYAFDDEAVNIIDVASGETLPQEVADALLDPAITKTAFNALFERTCINRDWFSLLGYATPIVTPVEQWSCTMIKTAYLGLPLSLEAAAAVLKLPVQKMEEGKALIRYFSIPCKPTAANGGRTRNLPAHAPEKWAKFKEYCIMDVEVERSLKAKLSFYDLPEMERRLYILDQQINDRGVLIDRSFVQSAISIDEAYKDELKVTAKDLTNLENPNSIPQLKDWIAEQTGVEVSSLTKESVKEILKTVPADEVIEVLKLRQELSKTSTKKYNAMLEAVGEDDRIRGLLQFYGANRTGRWAGRLVQVQNLPQNHLGDLDRARSIVADKDADLLELLYGNVPDTLSQLIRTAFIPAPGNTFIVADFSAIEARVIAWLAGEQWRLDVFNSHGKIYEASASQMFRVPIETVTKGSDLRQRGKVSELALGYQGGAGALVSMGALKMGLKESELPELVDRWRQANPNIVELWGTFNAAAKTAVKEGTLQTIAHGVSIEKRGSVLYINLPSGRRLSYFRPRMGTNRFGSESVIYEGMNQTTKKWEVVETYGGKLVENVVQAIARDCLAYAMLELDKYGYDIVMHVHDEVIIEVGDMDEDHYLADACKIMGEPIPWAPDLPLRADGYITNYYRKD